jgi:hypothetical protein
MHTAISRYRRPLTWAATLLLAVAYWHCAWEWQAELRHPPILASVHSAKEPPPGSPVQGCDNESGCICRGATLSHALGLEMLSAVASEWQVVGLPAAFGVECACHDTPPAPFDRWRATPPVSGRQLRALYASLLI